MSSNEPCNCAQALTYSAALEKVLDMCYAASDDRGTAAISGEAVFEIVWKALQTHSGRCEACYDASRDGCSQDNEFECESFRMRHY